MCDFVCSRTFLSIIGGVVAGIWGFTGLTGFIFYVLIMGITSLGLAAKAKFSAQTYFDNWNKILLDGFFGGLMVIIELIHLNQHITHHLFSFCSSETLAFLLIQSFESFLLALASFTFISLNPF